MQRPCSKLARDEKSIDAVKADLTGFDAMLADSPT